MSTDADAAVAKLEDVGVETRRIEPGEFAETIESVVDDPAVGVELEELAVSLADTAVDVDPTPAALKAAATGVTRASLCVADYGTLVLPDDDRGSELVSLFVDHHVAVLRDSDVVADMETAFERFDGDLREAMRDGESRTSRILATGPSATADMGELVIGAHGPERVTAVVLEE